MGIKAVGKYKMVVSLERKIPYFKLLMAFPLCFPQNEQAVKKYGSKYGTARMKLLAKAENILMVN
jgi:oligopeptide transport system substrate-binding protein